MKCHVCGRNFITARSDTKTCSSACRTKLSRMSDRITDLGSRARQIMLELSELAYVPDVSLQAVLEHNSIMQMSLYYQQNSKNSLWQCQSCNKLVHGVLPDEKSCLCDNPVWLLQKKML